MAEENRPSLEKDFGYLMPFFDKAAQAAGRLADPAAKAEALGLLEGEKARWARLRALLSGAAATIGVDRSSPPAEQPEPRAPALTVGALKPRRGP